MQWPSGKEYRGEWKAGKRDGEVGAGRVVSALTIGDDAADFFCSLVTWLARLCQFRVVFCRWEHDGCW